MFAFEAIELTAAETSDITRYTSFGEEWIREALFARRARRWAETYLEIIDNKSRTNGWRCYAEGEIVYKRKDGKPITQDDIDALNNFSFGQGNDIIGKVGDATVEQRWICDSSD